MEKDFKILFEKIGTEKPPEDFTAVVMRKIEAKNHFSLSHSLPKNSYWFLLPYLIALLMIVPFIVPTINWIINIDWSFISFDISFIPEWIERFKDSFTGITFSTQTIIISLASTVLLIISSIEIFAQSRRRVLD